MTRIFSFVIGAGWACGVATPFVQAGLAGLLLLLPALVHAESLSQLIQAALQGHPSIRSQQAQGQVAQSGLDSANYQRYPTPSINVEQANARSSDRNYPGDSMVATLRLQQPVWTGGRLTAGIDKAEAGISVSRASLEEVRQQLALRVVQSYGDWLSAYLKTQADEKSLASHVRLHEQVQRRIEQGASADSDLILAVSRLKLVAADIATARAQMAIALARLGQLLGQPVDAASLRAAIAAPRRLNANPQAMLDQALATNASVEKAVAQARVQEAVIAERRADLSPEVYVRLERQYGNYTFANAPAESRLFLGLSSRFGAGLSTFSNVEGAKSQHQAALAEVEVQSRAVSEQVLSDYALAASAESRLEALKASLDAAGQVSESYGRQFLAGRKTWLDVMNAARELAQTEIQIADIQSTQVVVTWRLAIYTQGIAAVTGMPQ